MNGLPLCPPSARSNNSLLFSQLADDLTWLVVISLVGAGMDQDLPDSKQHIMNLLVFIKGKRMV